MIYAIYARVSTQDKQYVENQIRVLEEWAERMGASSVVKYVDHASGSDPNRPELSRLLEDSRKRKVDVLLIWALDRLSREGLIALSNYLDKFKTYSVRVLSNQEPWLDTSGPISDLLVAIFGWVAQQERLRLKERIKAGLETAKAKGKKLGRPPMVFDLEQARILKTAGFSIRDIAKEVKVSKTTVARYLK